MKQKLRILLIFITSLFVLPSVPVKATSSLPSDISTHWARPYITYCIEHSYMTGVGNNKFNPDGTVTRAQMVQILYNMSGQPETEVESKFTDIASHWAKESITWAETQDITNGVSHDRFGPDIPVTREQAVVMLHNYEKPDAYPVSVLNKFKDRDLISVWAEKSMAWAVSSDIIKGSNNMLRPGDKLQRAELTVVIYNYSHSETTDPTLNADIESVISTADTANFTKYKDCCDSTDFERQVMYLITAVKYETLSPDKNWKSKHVINPLWYDARFVAKITCYELAGSNTTTTPRMKNYPDPKDYFQSIYSPRNLTTADYVTSYWYKAVHLPYNCTPQTATEMLLSDPEFTEHVKADPMDFYGIYYDTESRWLCVAHGMARVGH